MSQVAKRYAEALFQLANEKGILSEVGADLKVVKSVFESNNDFTGVLTAPKVSATKKKEIIKNVFAAAQPAVVNTLQILVDKKHINDVVAIVDVYENLAAAASGSAKAVVSSTRELTAEEREAISSSFSKLVGVEKLDITNEINPELIGGIRVQIGNYIYDSTIAAKLEGLKRTLVG